MLGPEPEAVPAIRADWSEPGAAEDLLAAAGGTSSAVRAGEAGAGRRVVLRMRDGGVAKHVGILARSPLGHADADPCLFRAWRGRIAADAGLGAADRRCVSFSGGASDGDAASGSGGLGAGRRGRRLGRGLGAMALGKAAGAIARPGDRPAPARRGSAPVETGRVERFRVMGSSEGAALPRAFGRNRVAGQLIWSSRFLESVHYREGRRQGRRRRIVREYSYSVSLAIALCEGEVSRIGRIWADGQAIDQNGLTLPAASGDARTSCPIR